MTIQKNWLRRHGAAKDLKGHKGKRRWPQRLGAGLFWLAVWYTIAILQGSELLLPYPHSVLLRLCELLPTGGFWLTTLASLFRFMAAFLIGAVAGSVLAAVCAASRTLSALISPALVSIRATPVASFIILLMLWLPGAGWVSLWSAVLMTIPIFWANIGRGIESVDTGLLEMGRVYALSAGQRLRHIYIPSLRPALISACESGIGLAWKSGVAAEVLTRPRLSIGRMVYETRIYLETVDLFAWTVTVVLMSLAVEKLVRRLLNGRRPI